MVHYVHLILAFIVLAPIAATPSDKGAARHRGAMSEWLMLEVVKTSIR